MRVEILYNKKGDGIVYPHVDMIIQGRQFLILKLRRIRELERVRKDKICDLAIYDKEWEDGE